MKGTHVWIAGIALIGWGTLAHASPQDINAIAGYVHTVTVGETRYDTDHSTMMHVFFAVIF